MNGVKSMPKRVNPKVEFQMLRIIDSFLELPMVNVKNENTNHPVRGKFFIDRHPPLAIVDWYFERHNRFWTKDYHLFLVAKTDTNATCSGVIRLVNKAPGIVINTSGGMNESQVPSSLREAVAANGILSKQWEKLDISECKLSWENGHFSVLLSPYAASCVCMLIPPLAYAVMLKEHEALALLQTMQILLSCAG